MKTNLKVSVSIKTYPLSSFGYDVVHTYVIDATLQDIVEYLFEQEYHKKYNELSWYLEDNAKEFVRDIEDKWMHNQIDEYALSNDPSFKRYLIKKYKDEIERDCYRKVDIEEYKKQMLEFIENNFDFECEVLIYE